MDSSKYVRYTPEQVEALERVYAECPKPTSLKRHQLIRECSILSNIDPKQIKVWFQNRRCREKQRKEASHLQTVNRKLTAMNKLLMEENDRLQKHVSHLVYDNGFMRQQLHTVNSTTTDTCCESVVVSGQQQQQNPMPQHHPQRDANSPAGLLAIAEETLTEFLGKATGTAVDWVQMIGMKPGPESIGIVAVSRNCNGVAARACGLVSLEPMKVAEILKDRPSWYRDCRCLDILNVIPTGNGGTIELIYLQTYAPTTLAPARDFWTLRYTTSLEDGSLVICERSLTSNTGGPVGPPATSSVRAKMLPSGFLIRPCEGGGSIIHIVDHIDLDACSVPEVLRPLYESSKILAQKLTMAAFRYIRQIAQETSGEIQYAGGRQPAVLRAFSQRLCRGFNNAVSGFIDDGWTIMGSDGVDDVTIAVNSSPSKFLDAQYNTLSILPTFGGVLCARASMLLQDVCPALLVRFLREHRSEWADYGVDAYSSASLKASPYAVPCARPGVFPSSQVILPLAQTVEHEEFLEVVRLEGHAFSPEDIALSRDMYLLQLCSGVEENATGACAQLVFAHIDESFGDDAPLLPSGFSVIPLEPKSDSPSAARTLDLASTLEARTGGTRPAGEVEGSSYNHRSVLTIAFQFAFENHYRENVAAMARQYVRSIVGSVQRVAMAIAPSRLCSQLTPKSFPGSPEAVTLARWICRSYKNHTGGELLQMDSQAAGDAVLKQLWHHTDSIMCCSVKMNDSAFFSFANQAGLDMLETQTTGFTGDLAFNITVDPKDPPNVLILMVESFRARDSLYLAGHTNAAAKLKEHNLTITPQFDKWAKRGIAFSNLWSSFQTSRSLESVLWAQLPYDKLESSATVGGRTNVKLAGLPQFFTQKGYDVMFSAGSRINYDDWETFLPSHGFDTIVSSNDYKKMAQQTMNLTENDWDNGNSHRKRDMYWGVHDDISFQLLGDTLIKKLGEQKARIAKGELKKPFFIDHYTISSHMIWDGMPQWYVDQLEQTKELLPYLALAEGEFSYLIQCYHKLRYFTDQELGKFLTRMEKEGVLKDTIIIITGDHGHSPEMGYSGNEANQEATTHVAGMLLAEGHMDEKDKGTMMNDAVAHYDILNTLADIVGVPEGGFPQNGIGRSLKRAVPFGERLVYSNNPLRKLSIVKGDKRFVYDRATVTNAVLLHDVIQDTELKNDLFLSIDAEAQKKWMALRDTGRMLNDYYTNKWNTGCMAEAPCPK